MSQTPFRVVPVKVTVDAAGTPVCDPDTANVVKDTKHALVVFTLNAPGYRFPATDAIKLDQGQEDDSVAAAEDNFPYESWTISDTQAALYDNNKTKQTFGYTVTVVNIQTGQEHSVDPDINNGGGGISLGKGHGHDNC